jgi:hypothetical protein
MLYYVFCVSLSRLFYLHYESSGFLLYGLLLLVCYSFMMMLLFWLIQRFDCFMLMVKGCKCSMVLLVTDASGFDANLSGYDAGTLEINEMKLMIFYNNYFTSDLTSLP